MKHPVTQPGHDKWSNAQMVATRDHRRGTYGALKTMRVSSIHSIDHITPIFTTPTMNHSCGRPGFMLVNVAHVACVHMPRHMAMASPPVRNSENPTVKKQHGNKEAF